MKMYLLLISFAIIQSASAQNTGIGTTTPRAKLHIKGTTDTSQLVIDANATQSNLRPLVRLRNASGVDLMHIHTDEPRNTFVGLNAGRVNDVASGALANTFIGALAGSHNSSGYSLTALGHGALFSNNTGGENTAVGSIALYYNTSGVNNTAMGRGALYQNSSGNNNTSTGFRALFSNTIGDNNTAYGSQAMASTTIATYNTAMGAGVLFTNSVGSRNTAYGYSSLYFNTLGEDNTGMGMLSLLANTVGFRNTGVGAEALRSNTSGAGNTAVGYLADIALNNSNYNTIIGYKAGVSGSNSTVIGSNAYTTSSNVALLGNTTTLYCGGYVNWTNYVSDGRLKKSVDENVKGLDFIMRLRPVTYHIDVRGIYKKWGISPYGKEENKMTASHKTEIDEGIKNKEAIRMSGFIAQEVEQAAKQSGYDFDGIKKPDNENDNYGLSYATFVVPLVKAVQEQQVIIKNQKKEIDELKARLDKIEKLMGSK